MRANYFKHRKIHQRSAAEQQQQQQQQQHVDVVQQAVLRSVEDVMPTVTVTLPAHQVRPVSQNDLLDAFNVSFANLT